MDSYSKYIKSVLLRYVILSALIFWGLSSLILSPLYVVTASDVLYSQTNIPEIFDLLIQICDIAVYSLCFSTIVYSIYKFKLAGSVNIIMTYCASSFIRYTINIVMTVIMDGSISASEDVIVNMLYFILDSLIALTVALISNSIFSKFKKNISVIEKANTVLRVKNESIKNILFPFTKIYCASNPFQRSALIIGIILSLIKISTRFIYDLYIGIPTSIIDGVWMAVYYISDILICAIVYLISLLVFTRLNNKDKKITE